VATDKPLLLWDANTGDLLFGLFALTIIHGSAALALPLSNTEGPPFLFFFVFVFVCFFLFFVCLFVCFCCCFCFTMGGQGGLYEARHRYKTRLISMG